MRRRAGHPFTIAIFALMSAGPVSAQRPAELTHALEVRDKATLRTARIEYVEQSIVIAPDGQRVERPLHYYTWQCAGDDFLSVDQGDEEGVVMRDAEGRPRDDLTYHGPQHYLVKGNELWRHVEESPAADVFGPQRSDFFRLHDLRRLGLDPVTLGQDVEATCRANGLPLPEYRCSMESGLYLVTATVGPGEIRWWIDPDRGWNVVRSAVLREGQETTSMYITLAPTEHIWFPQMVEYIRRTADGHELSTIYTILSSEFNRPQHPQELSPADIGVQPGTNLLYQDRDNARPAVWDGHAAVSLVDYRAQLKSRAPRTGPDLGQEPSGAKPPEDPAEAHPPVQTSDYVRVFESDWSAYTRQFIRKNRLNVELSRKAWEVCRHCEAAGRSYVESRRADFDDWQRHQDEAKGAPSETRAVRQEKLDTRKAELTAPLQRIFEERLKPGLDKLLGSRQPETQPAGK